VGLKLGGLVGALAFALGGLTACHPEMPNGTAVRAAFPSDHDTGPEMSSLDEDNLPACTPASGSWVITTSGSYGGCRFDGRIRVQAANVTLHDMVITGNTGGSPIILNEGPGPLTVERSVIGPPPPSVDVDPTDGDPTPTSWPNVGTGGEPCGSAIAYGNYTLTASEAYGCADGIKLAAAVTVTDSYVHDLFKGCHPNHPAEGDCTHNDGAQKNDGNTLTSLTFTGNAMYLHACNSNRAFQMSNLANASLDISVNFFYGSHGIANADKQATATNTGAITGNTYAGSLTSGPFSASSGHASPGLYTGVGLTNVGRAGNTFEDGAAVPETGQMDPYTCTP